MVKHFHKEFLKSPSQYRLAEDYWRELWERLVKEAHVADKWRYPWLAAPFRNGDPIFSAVSPDDRRGVHVIQHEPTSDETELAWWVDEFGEEGIDEVISQLVISCALSQQAVDRAKELLVPWITRGTVESTAEELPEEEGRVESLFEQARQKVKPIVAQEKTGEKIDRELLILCLR